jgi:RNA polymerase sigma-70 factor (ECF subfamily)
MDREAFRAFYETTAPALLAYLRHVTRDATTAEDLMQECYVRMLAATLPEPMSERHRRHYLFRIGANLVQDRFRALRHEGGMPMREPATPDASRAIEFKQLVDLALTQVRPEDRQLLWLAHAEQMSHQEIAGITGYRVGSIRPLLSQARRRLAAAVRTLTRSA